MSQAPPPLPPAGPHDEDDSDDSAKSDDLQFDTAEPSAGAAATQAPASATCAACGQPITGSYYAADDKVVCPNCRDAYVASQTGGSRIGRLFRATVFGVIAGLGGALIWFAVRKLTGYEVGLIAILVGLMVGGAVKVGARGRGGVGYQILAVLLTYFSICANYMPDIFMMLRDEFRQEEQLAASSATQPTTAIAATTLPTSAPVEGATTLPTTMVTTGGPFDTDEKPSAGMMLVGVIVLLVLMFMFSLVAPFLGGSIIGLLIIAFALWEAWKINARPRMNLTGPYTLGAGAPAAGAQPGGA